MTTTVDQGEDLIERIEEGEREVMFCEERYAGLRDGTLRWQQEYPEMFTASHDPQQDAAEQAATELDCARRDLEALQAEANRRAQDTEWGDAR